ncbi:T9SS type A sorting domain-containing protein, partial [candidate division WOR-3 bacterium]|nr:T9SS type A sorting domain-containing protein [candidate division WOR-3 bacterium]
YDNWPIPPSMVMLVGDVDQIGFFTGQGAGSPHTDLNFTMLAGGDYLPDIDLCRASVANAAQLDSLVQKTLRYEQDPGSVGTDWLDKAYFIASSDGGNHQVTEATHLYCMRKLRALGVVCDSIWLYYGQGTPITTAVNGGRSWVTYSGHGNTDCWADPEPNFDLAAVHALTNAGMVPWVQTYACLSGDYTSTTYPECFSEAWIRNGTRGAVAHMASTVTSYWTEDDTLQRRVFDYMFDSLDCLVGGGVNRAKLKYYEQMGNNSTTRRYFEMYNVIGDGAIDVFSQQPAALTVTHPPVIPLGAYPLQVTVQRSGLPVRDALVCAAGRDDTTVFASAYTDGAGQVVLNITTTAPDSVFVTVTGHNLEPYLGACLARPSSGPYVMLLRTAVDDSSGGNNDGIINPGETINLPAWLKNWGSAAAENVRAWLRCQDPNVTLLDSLKTFGTIAAHDSASTGPDGFGFSVAASCTNGYGLRFTLAVKDANDSTWTSPLNLAVGAPVLGYVSNRADDPPPGGNGNGMIEPGETGELMVELRNTGLGHAYNVTAVLRSGDSRLAVLDSTGSYPVILRDSTALNAADRFRVHADASIPRETRVPCTLEVAVGGATYTRVFELGIGVIRVCDPIPDGPRQPSVYYAYDDTDTMYTGRPQFNWVEIRGLGTRLSLSDDQTVTISLPAGFGPWIYYGQSHNQVSICSNGWVAPGQTAVTTYNNTSLPNTSMPAAVFINWDDLYPPAGGGVWYYHDEASHRFIVEYDSVRYYSGTNCDKNQVIIYDTTVAAGDNHIVLQYLTANQTGSATVGLQDHTRSVMIEALFNGAYHRGCAALAPGRAMMMAAVPPAVGVAGPGDESPGRLGFVRCGPNPLRGRASIVYSVPRATNVSLAVFDAAGRLVRSLQRGEQRPGIHAATWDRTDGQGRPVSHGVYFYRLEADGVRLARKVVAVR